MSFENLGLGEPVLRAVRAEGYAVPTPVQLQTIPSVLMGRDLVGCAQTGTGKTAAFALPTLHRLSARSTEPAAVAERRPAARKIRALVLSPTRELAVQIGESFSAYGKYTGLRHAVVYGGVSQVPQVRALRAGVDGLIATPGRLLDLMGQGYVTLAAVEVLILDEADRMLDMGFIHDLRRIVRSVPRQRQTLMFSATMPEEIRRLASEWLSNPIRVEVAPPEFSAERVGQSVFFIEQKQKPLLLSHYLRNTPSTRTLVFSRTKHGADKIVRQLEKAGITAAAIHGNKSQAARQRVLRQFKSEQPPVLVATDVAARGLDIDNVSHVINYDLPMEPETYVHRIGRTGRAGATGTAISFCGHDERSRLRSIERLLGRSITIEKPRTNLVDHTSAAAAPQPKEPQDGTDRAGGRHAASGERRQFAPGAKRPKSKPRRGSTDKVQGHAHSQTNRPKPGARRRRRRAGSTAR